MHLTHSGHRRYATMFQNVPDVLGEPEEVLTPKRINKKPRTSAGLFVYMARVEGFEPPTAWFVARYSIQLSYTRVVRFAAMPS